MGLPRILVFSALTGISFSAAIGASGVASDLGAGLGIFNFSTVQLDPSLQTLMVIVSSIFTIFFIFRLAKFFREVVDYQAAGVLTAFLGFIGSFLVMLSPQNNSHVFVVGIGVWIFGIFIVIFYRKKN